MATRRKRRPRVGPAKPAKKPDGFPQWEHESSFTFEGEMERLGAMGRNLSNAPRWTRLVARIVALAILLPIAVGLFFFVLHLFTD